MALNKSDIESGLKKKGFFIANTDHERFIYKTRDGATTTVRTKLSFGSKKDVDEGLIHLMAKQCQLNKKEFQDLGRVNTRVRSRQQKQKAGSPRK